MGFEPAGGIVRASILTAQLSTAVLRINRPIHRGQPNPAHGKFFLVGSVPAACYDASRGASHIYETEDAAIDAAFSAGATDIQRTDCSFAVRNGQRVAS